MEQIVDDWEDDEIDGEDVGINSHGPNASESNLPPILQKQLNPANKLGPHAVPHAISSDTSEMNLSTPTVDQAITNESDQNKSMSNLETEETADVVDLTFEDSGGESDGTQGRVEKSPSVNNAKQPSAARKQTINDGKGSAQTSQIVKASAFKGCTKCAKCNKYLENPSITRRRLQKRPPINNSVTNVSDQIRSMPSLEDNQTADVVDLTFEDRDESDDVQNQVNIVPSILPAVMPKPVRAKQNNKTKSLDADKQNQSIQRNPSNLDASNNSCNVVTLQHNNDSDSRTQHVNSSATKDGNRSGKSPIAKKDKRQSTDKSPKIKNVKNNTAEKSPRIKKTKRNSVENGPSIDNAKQQSAEKSPSTKNAKRPSAGRSSNIKDGKSNAGKSRTGKRSPTHRPSNLYKPNGSRESCNKARRRHNVRPSLESSHFIGMIDDLPIGKPLETPLTPKKLRRWRKDYKSPSPSPHETNSAPIVDLSSRFTRDEEITLDPLGSSQSVHYNVIHIETSTPAKEINSDALDPSHPVISPASCINLHSLDSSQSVSTPAKEINSDALDSSHPVISPASCINLHSLDSSQSVSSIPILELDSEVVITPGTQIQIDTLDSSQSVVVEYIDQISVLRLNEDFHIMESNSFCIGANEEIEQTDDDFIYETEPVENAESQAIWYSSQENENEEEGPISSVEEVITELEPAVGSDFVYENEPAEVTESQVIWNSCQKNCTYEEGPIPSAEDIAELELAVESVACGQQLEMDKENRIASFAEQVTIVKNDQEHLIIRENKSKKIRKKSHQPSKITQYSTTDNVTGSHIKPGNNKERFEELDTGNFYCGMIDELPVTPYVNIFEANKRKQPPKMIDELPVTPYVNIFEANKRKQPPKMIDELPVTPYVNIFEANKRKQPPKMIDELPVTPYVNIFEANKRKQPPKTYPPSPNKRIKISKQPPPLKKTPKNMSNQVNQKIKEKSKIKHRKKILATIDQITARKRCPTLDRISRIMFKSHKVSVEDTKADLNRCIKENSILKIDTKNNVSYRNAATWKKGSKRNNSLVNKNKVLQVSDSDSENVESEEIISDSNKRNNYKVSSVKRNNEGCKKLTDKNNKLNNKKYSKSVVQKLGLTKYIEMIISQSKIQPSLLKTKGSIVKTDKAKKHLDRAVNITSDKESAVEAKAIGTPRYDVIYCNYIIDQALKRYTEKAEPESSFDEDTNINKQVNHEIDKDGDDDLIIYNDIVNQKENNKEVMSTNDKIAIVKKKKPKKITDAEVFAKIRSQSRRASTIDLDNAQALGKWENASFIESTLNKGLEEDIVDKAGVNRACPSKKLKQLMVENTENSEAMLDTEEVETSTENSTFEEDYANEGIRKRGCPRKIKNVTFQLPSESKIDYTNEGIRKRGCPRKIKNVTFQLPSESKILTKENTNMTKTHLELKHALVNKNKVIQVSDSDGENVESEEIISDSNKRNNYKVSSVKRNNEGCKKLTDKNNKLNNKKYSKSVVQKLGLTKYIEMIISQSKIQPSLLKTEGSIVKTDKAKKHLDRAVNITSDKESAVEAKAIGTPRYDVIYCKYIIDQALKRYTEKAEPESSFDEDTNINKQVHHEIDKEGDDDLIIYNDIGNHKENHKEVISSDNKIDIVKKKKPKKMTDAEVFAKIRSQSRRASTIDLDNAQALGKCKDAKDIVDKAGVKRGCPSKKVKQLMVENTENSEDVLDTEEVEMSTENSTFEEDKAIEGIRKRGLPKKIRNESLQLPSESKIDYANEGILKRGCPRKIKNVTFQLPSESKILTKENTNMTKTHLEFKHGVSDLLDIEDSTDTDSDELEETEDFISSSIIKSRDIMTEIVSDIILKPCELSTLEIEDLKNDSAVQEMVTQDCLDFNWKEKKETFIGKREQFTGKSGPKFAVSRKTSIIDVFDKMIDAEFVDLICWETNRYGRQKQAGAKKNKALLRSKNSKSKWTSTNRDEMLTFLAFLMLQALYPTEKEDSYFLFNGFGTMPYFGKVMNFKRYKALKSNLHFVDNTNLVLKSNQNKARPIIDYFNRKFSRLYYPSQDIIFDEYLLQSHERIDISEKISTKVAHSQNRVKSYELCESSSGYIWRFSIHPEINRETGAFVEIETENDYETVIDTVVKMDDIMSENANKTVIDAIETDNMLTDTVPRKIMPSPAFLSVLELLPVYSNTQSVSKTNKIATKRIETDFFNKDNSKINALKDTLHRIHDIQGNIVMANEKTACRTIPSLSYLSLLVLSPIQSTTLSVSKVGTIVNEVAKNVKFFDESFENNNIDTNKSETNQISNGNIKKNTTVSHDTKVNTTAGKEIDNLWSDDIRIVSVMTIDKSACRTVPSLAYLSLLILSRKMTSNLPISNNDKILDESATDIANTGLMVTENTEVFVHGMTSNCTKTDRLVTCTEAKTINKNDRYVIEEPGENISEKFMNDFNDSLTTNIDDDMTLAEVPDLIEKDEPVADEIIGGSSDSSAKIIYELLEPLFNRGHTLIVDRYYNSPLLARCLKRHKTDCYGTLRMDQQRVPETMQGLTKKDFQPGEAATSYCHDLSMMVYRDREIVTMLSTYHHDLQMRKIGTTDEPQIIKDYNKSMEGIHRKERYLSSYPMERIKTRVWYQKLFLRLLNMAIFNCFVIYSRDITINYRDFRKILAEELLRRHKNIDLTTEPRFLSKMAIVSSSSLNNKELIDTKAGEVIGAVLKGRRKRLQHVEGDHFPVEVTTKSRCAVCHKSKGNIVQCKECRKNLCVLYCFRNYHKE